METLALQPLRSGPLDGLRFTVKDNIDIAGSKTSFGSPSWRESHPVAKYSALCVEQLLAAGATYVGKFVADELTYSLEGENPYYGTPLNARAPERMPGGSSSGSASSVACQLADFSIGTDSGGSIRVPASFCGVWGMRPSLHRISEAGVLPFMPSVSTVGAVATGCDVLDRVMRDLLRSGDEPAEALEKIFLLEDAFELADAPVREVAERETHRLSARAGVAVERIRFSEVVGCDIDLRACNERALRDLQTAEFINTVGEWIETCQPRLGPTFTMAYENVKAFDRTAAFESFNLCERLFQATNKFLQPGRVVIYPTTPTIAPLKGSIDSLDAVVDFYDRTMALTCFAGVGRLPEISAPLLSAEKCPVGLSIAAAHYRDEFLLGVARRLFKESA